MWYGLKIYHYYEGDSEISLCKRQTRSRYAKYTGINDGTDDKGIEVFIEYEMVCKICLKKHKRD